MAKKAPTIVVKRIKKGGHGHHGGSWKIAYADFVTAMMAFFLVMWMTASLGKSELQGIAEYFKNPFKKQSTVGGPNQASGNQITPSQGNTLQTIAHPPVVVQPPSMVSNPILDRETFEKVLKEAVEKKIVTKEDLEHAQMMLEQGQMVKLKEQIEMKLKSSPEFQKFQNQIKLEVTKEGLRIQLEDIENRPMFANASAGLYPDTQSVLEALGKTLNSLPNKIVVSGYTDAAPFSNNEYSNWELSVDRANASRRALIAGGLTEDRIQRVAGFGSTDPQDKKNALNPINRRISILLMYTDEQRQGQ